MPTDTETVDLHVDFDAMVRSDAMPHRERTRADGVPWRRPDGWHYTDIVAVVIEARFDPVVTVETPFESLGREGMVRYEAVVTAGTDSLDDDRVRIVDRTTVDGDPDRQEFEETTEAFDVEDALDNL